MKLKATSVTSKLYNDRYHVPKVQLDNDLHKSLRTLAESTRMRSPKAKSQQKTSRCSKDKLNQAETRSAGEPSISEHIPLKSLAQKHYFELTPQKEHNPELTGDDLLDSVRPMSVFIRAPNLLEAAF